VHGLAFWFDVAFIGSVQTIWLSTAPTEPLTHWYQVRCLLETPIFVKAGQLLTGRALLVANQRCVHSTETVLFEQCCCSWNDTLWTDTHTHRLPQNMCFKV